jgi:hypothetical protein
MLHFGEVTRTSPLHRAVCTESNSWIPCAAMADDHLPFGRLIVKFGARVQPLAQSKR